MNGVSLWLNKYRVRSSIVLSVAIYMLVDIQRWGMSFASSSTLSGVETAAVLAAAQVPATFFAGWAFKVFQETKTL